MLLQQVLLCIVGSLWNPRDKKYKIQGAI